MAPTDAAAFWLYRTLPCRVVAANLPFIGFVDDGGTDSAIGRHTAVLVAYREGWYQEVTLNQDARAVTEVVGDDRFQRIGHHFSVDRQLSDF